MAQTFDGIAKVEVDAHRWYALVHLTPSDPAVGRITLVFDAQVQAGDALTFFASKQEWEDRLKKEGLR